MKFFKTLAVVLAACGIVFLLASCGGNSPTATTSQPTISSVQRGNIRIAVTGTGNLALEYKQGLSFGQTGLVSQASNAKIAEVMVNPGDTVKEGQVLVKADTSDLEDTLTQDQHNLDKAKADLLAAQNNLANDEMKLAQQSDVAAIQTRIDNANIQITTAETMRSQAMVSQDANASNLVDYWNKNIEQYRSDITRYQKEMADLLADPLHYLAANVNGSAASVNAIKNLQMQIEQDKSNIILRQNAVDEAQSTMDSHKNMAQEITAPFDGLITKVNVKPGDIKSRSDNLIEIAQPDKFIANIMVTERDVMSIKTGGDATVSFDALSGFSFPAKITQIAPLATIQQGVVNYEVTVELTSIRPILANKITTSGQTGQQFIFQSPPSSSGISGAAPPDGITIPTATPAPSDASGTPRALFGNSSAAGTMQSPGLKDGLSATVDIVLQERSDVLMVPSRAVTRQGQTSTVQKVIAAGTEQVTVQTGITDGTNTEIISGLSEGDQVSVPPRTASTSSSQRLMQGGGFMIR